MVKSRKYAIVTAALALVLVAAVVLTVALTGSGVFYTPEQEGGVSNTAVSVGSSTGEVDDDYIYTTLLSRSQKKNSEWTEADMRDLRGADGNPGTDGIVDTFVTTLDTNTRLLTQNGWSDVDAGTLNIANKSRGGSGYYEVYYGGAWYRFQKNSADDNSLFMSYHDFMNNTTYYQNSSEYALIIEPDGIIQYNPTVLGKNQFFDATLDGAGATLQPSERLNVSRGTGKRGADGGTAGTIFDRYPTGTEDNSANIDSDFDWFSNDRFNYHISKDSNSNYDFHGLNSVGMIFGSVCEGTFKNLKWNDSNLQLSRDDNNYGGHFYSFLEMASSTAFGGLVGVAAPLNAGGTETSTITNVSITYNNYVRHVYDLQHYDDWIDTRCAIFTGGLVGVNMNANISNVTVRMNKDIKFEQRSACVNVGTGWRSADNGFTAFGGVVGLQNCNKTFEKVIISGSNKSSLYGHHQPIDKGSAGYNRTESRQGMVIGYLANNNKLTVNGAILDMNYNECYAWTNKNKSLYRGMLVGQVQSGSSITYLDIYITDMVFGEVYDKNTGIGQQYGTNGRPTPADVGIKGGEHDFHPIGTYFGDYTAQYWFDGDAENDQSFGYIDESKVSEVSFSDDPDYMLEISAPDGNKGVLWNVKWSEYGGSHTVKMNNDVFTQNTREDVKVKGFGAYDGVRGKNYYLQMSAEYASSYTFDVTNGPEGDGTSTKYYDGEQVNFPALSLNISDSNYVISNAPYDADGYILIEEEKGEYILYFYNGSGVGVGSGIDNYYNSAGTQFDADFNSVVATVLRLESMQNGEYATVDLSSWNTQKNVNSYRWNSLGLFAMADEQGKKYVFAPSAVEQAEVQITPRPVHLAVNRDSKNVPYIGNSYNIALGGAAQDGSVFFSFGTSADDGKSAVISGDDITVLDFSLTKDDSAVSAAQDVGTYAINPSSLEGAARGNYTLENAPTNANTFVIDKAQVKLEVTGGSATYGFTKPADAAGFMQMVSLSFTSSNSPLTGFASRDNIVVNMNIQTQDTATSAGEWLITPSSGGRVFAHNFPVGDYTVQFEQLSGSGALNYEVTEFVNTTPFTINKAQLAVNLPEIEDFIYGGSPAVGTPSYPGLMAVDSVTNYTVSYTSGTDAYTAENFVAGSYSAQAVITAINSPGSKTGIDNYNITYGKQEFEVFKRDTTVQFDYDPDASYTYKGEAYSFTALALGNPAFNDNDGIAGKVTFQAYSDVDRLTQTQAKNADTYYTGAVSDTLRANYNITGITDKKGDAWETFTIGKATVTLSNTDTTKAVYNESPITFDSSLIQIDFLGVDTLESEREALIKALSYTYNGSSAAPTDAGTYNVIVTLANQSNYDTATLNIDRGLFIDQMTITIVPAKTEDSKTYNGEMFPDLTYTVQGTNGEIEGLSIVTTYAKEGGEAVSSMRDAGTYIVTYKYDGATGNYKSATAEVKYTVTPATLNITLHNTTAVYNKKAYTPDFEITSGLIVGDNADITYNVLISGEIQENYEIINAGEYTLQFSAGNANYTIAGSDANQTINIEKYVLSAQAVNTTVFFNSENRTPDYYENQLRVRVIDADGSDIGSVVTITKELLEKENSAPVTEVSERGGDYQVKVTVTLPDTFNPDNYDVQESVYSVFIYRIALSGALNGGTDTDSVTYGSDFDIKGVLTAMAGDKPQALEVGSDGAVLGIAENEDLTDVSSITVTSATISVSGKTLAITNNAVSLDNISSDINAIFNTGIFNEGFANAGTYTATIEITLDAVYKETSLNRTVTLSAPFIWTVDPVTILVEAGDVHKYYTESVTTADVLAALTVDEQYKGYISVVSYVIDDTASTYVNKGTYQYDVVLNTQAEGYYNYTLPAVNTGNIVIDPLRLVVTVANASAEYGVAPTLSADAQLFKGDELFENAPAGLSAQYSWVLSSSKQVGSNVGNYEGALTAVVTATSNFTHDVVAGDLTITARKLNITLDNVSITYSNGDFDVTYTISGGTLFGSDTRPELSYTSATLDGYKVNFNRVQVKEGGYVLNIEGAAFDNTNYVIGDIKAGKLTVTPYQITSVNWSDPGTLTYKGAAFEEGELFTVESFTNTNGDIVTFSVNYDKEVKNAGSYTARVAVASVSNGSDPVDNANYSVASVAAKSFSVAKASLTVSDIRDGLEMVGDVPTLNAVYNTMSQAITQDEITFVFGEGIEYNAAEHGSITLAITHALGGIPTDPINAGSYEVSISVRNAENFNNATITVAFVINKWILTQEEAGANFDIAFDESYTYDATEHEATLSFRGTLAGFAAPYTFTYYMQAADGSLTAANPVNAGTYLIAVSVGNDNYEYVTEEGVNEGSFKILPTDKIQLNFSVPQSEGLDPNNVYYTGGPIVPSMSATITVVGQPERVTSNDAFTFTFYTVAPAPIDGTTTDLSTVEGLEYLPENTYYYYEEVTEAIRPNSYYIVATFNAGGEYSNYATGYSQLYVSNNVPTAMVITQGAMSVRVVNGLTRAYDGTIGFNGRDIIYQDSDGLYWINTDILTFTGVDLAGMDNLNEDLKVGNITISVYFLFERDVEDDGSRVERMTKLYDWVWNYDYTSDERSNPQKTVYSTPVMDGGYQVSGPMNGISDFGFANGFNTAEYVIRVEIDNTGEGSYYLPAQEVKVDEDGEPVLDENDKPQYDPAPHKASGYAYISPAAIEFDMYYKNDFYNDGKDMVDDETGGYRELNNSVDDSDGMPVLTPEQLSQLAHYVMRGTQISLAEDFDWLAGITRTKYAVLEGGINYQYEALGARYIKITITRNSDGKTVYTYSNGVNSSAEGGIAGAGTYTVKFEFTGIAGKYEPFTFTGLFEQQKAEYHITVTQKENANLKTPFGTEFNLNGVAEQLEIKIEIKASDYITNTGKYLDFEKAVSDADGDTTQLSQYIALTGADGNIATEYVDSYKSNVGRYFIYYVFISQDPNLEIVMETESSMIEVVQAAPTIMVDAEGNPVDKEKGLTLESQAYQPNYSWNNDILAQVGLGLEYMKLNAEGNGHIAAGENYTTKNVAVATIDYSLDGDSWTPASSVGPVGKYRLTLQSADTNLVGALEEVYVYFEVTKIKAQANVVLNGYAEEGGVFSSTYNGAAHSVGFSVKADGNVVSDAALAGTVNILVAFTENAGDDAYVNIEERNIINAGSYWVKVTVEGSANYEVAPSQVVKITINKADPTIRFEQSEYNLTYNMKGNTISADDISFELNGRVAPDITEENSLIMYLSVTAENAETALAQQDKVAEMVNAFVASGESNIAEWLTAQQGSGKYAGYEFTSVNGAPAATDAGFYFPVVIFNGDANYKASGTLVTNVPNPLMTVNKAELILNIDETAETEDMTIVYGGALSDITGKEEVDKYLYIYWSYIVGDDPVPVEGGEVIQKLSYRLANMNAYTAGDSVGRVENALQLVVDEFESKNFVLSYNDNIFVDVEVKPKEVAFDISKVSVSLATDADQVAPQPLTEQGYTFERVYNGSAFGPLVIAYDSEHGELGLEINGDNSVRAGDNGVGKYGIFDITASGGFVQKEVSTAGSYSAEVKIALNNTENYKVTSGLGEDNTLTVKVNMVIEKAILKISFDRLTYVVDENKDGEYEFTYTDKVDNGTGDHTGWYEYATMYTGANFDYNNRVYITSYRRGADGTLKPYGKYETATVFSKVGGITESDGASGNLAAPGEYNIHLALDQLATNYKFIDSAGNTLGQAADGSQADLSSLDINVTISPSEFVTVEFVTVLETIADKRELFTYDENNAIFTREFDGTDINASFIKNFLEVTPYKLASDAGTLDGDDPIELVPDRNYAGDSITNYVSVSFADESGKPVTSVMYAGTYTMTVDFTRDTHDLADGAKTYTLQIKPTAKFEVKKTVKGQTERTYNGTDIVPNLSFTVTVTDFNGKPHTIDMTNFKVNVYKDGALAFTYDVTNGTADVDAISGKFRDAGIYTIKAEVNNANLSATVIEATATDYTINARDLTDKNIRIAPHKAVFDYRTENNQAVAVSAEDLGVVIAYNRVNLVMGEDFEIEFVNGAGKYTGTYTFKINGKGNYSGTIERTYSIGASVGIAEAPDAITYGDDSLTVKMAINSLGGTEFAGELVITFDADSVAKIVDANNNIVAQLGTPGSLKITKKEIQDGVFTMTFTGLGGVNAGDYNLHLVFTCDYNTIKAKGEISKKASGDNSKVVVNEADVEAAAKGVTATVTAVNSSSVSFNINGEPSVYEYSLDGTTWWPAVKGANTISGLSAASDFIIRLRINDSNYAKDDVHEYPLTDVTLRGTTTASVDDIIESAESLARNFNATGFARYAQLLQNVAMVSSGDLAARGDEIDEALAAVEEARAKYVQDLQAAVDSAVGAAEKAAGKGSGASTAATAGLVAGGVSLPVLGIGLIFAAARKRKSKEDDLND